MELTSYCEVVLMTALANSVGSWGTNFFTDGLRGPKHYNFVSVTIYGTFSKGYRLG